MVSLADGQISDGRQYRSVSIEIIYYTRSQNLITLQILQDLKAFKWMIVVRTGQVFKYSQKVFKYQHRYLGI